MLLSIMKIYSGILKVDGWICKGYLDIFLTCMLQFGSLKSKFSQDTLIWFIFFQEKFSKIQSPKATGHLSLSARIWVICITERM